VTDRVVDADRAEPDVAELNKGRLKEKLASSSAGLPNKLAKRPV